MVTVSNIEVSINDKPILKIASCFFPCGRVTLLLGSSGAGKTTLLQTLVGLITPERGTITLDDIPLQTLSPKQRAQRIGYLFQDFQLFNNMTVLENCIDPLIVHGILYSLAKKQALRILKTFNMSDCAEKYPDQLSGGQKQRAALARMLCLQPTILVLDEPTASLDRFNTDILIDTLKNLAHQNFTIIIASQDLYFIKKMLDRTYYLKQGSIVETCENREAIKNCPTMHALLA